MGKRARIADGLAHSRLGYKQQVVQHEVVQVGSGVASSTEQMQHSVLVSYLIHEIMWGLISPGRAQEIADVAWIDGARCADLGRGRQVGVPGRVGKKRVA